MSTPDFNLQITEVSGSKVMADGKVRKWVREFRGGRENVVDEERSCCQIIQITATAFLDW